MSKSALTVCFCLLLVATAGAQITITENDIPRAVGDSFMFKVTADNATVNVGPTGGPQVWAFDTSTYVGGLTTSEIVDKSATPLGARFPDANITIQQLYGPYGLWVYRKLDADQMLDLGAAMQRPDTVIGFNYNPTGINLDLPLTLGTAWQTVFGYTDTTSDSTQTVVLNNYDCRVDAWGTATCPAGIYPCLRLNVFQTEMTTEYLRGVVTTAETVLTRRYHWGGPAIGTFAMAHSMEGDTNSNFTLADDYMILVWTNRAAILEQRDLPVAAPARIRPNPCAGSTLLSLAPGVPGPVLVRVCDATGRVVLSRTLNVGRHASSILLDLRGNQAGVYFCTVTAGSRTVKNELVLLQ